AVWRERDRRQDICDGLGRLDRRRLAGLLHPRAARDESRSAGGAEIRVKSEPPAVASGSSQYQSQLENDFNHALPQVVLTRHAWRHYSETSATESEVWRSDQALPPSPSLRW